jgi:hypothetical protein
MTTLGRCSCEFAVFCSVRPLTVHVTFPDSPWLADSPQGAHGPFGRPFTQRHVFAVGEDFCTADSPRLTPGQPASSLADSPRQLGGQSDLYVESCQV